MSAHDRWLANYHTSLEEVWCENPKCEHSQDSLTVRYEEEYGQGSITPEECPMCRGDLTFDRPPEATEADLSPSDASSQE